jgi:hypothetical protein
MVLFFSFNFSFPAPHVGGTAYFKYLSGIYPVSGISPWRPEVPAMDHGPSTMD